MKKRIMAIMSATILGISALNFSAFAETANTTNEAKNNFQKPLDFWLVMCYYSIVRR